MRKRLKKITEFKLKFFEGKKENMAYVMKRDDLPLEIRLPFNENMIDALVLYALIDFQMSKGYTPPFEELRKHMEELYPNVEINRAVLHASLGRLEEDDLVKSSINISEYSRFKGKITFKFNPHPESLQVFEKE